MRLVSSSVNNVSNLVISDSAVSRLRNIAGDGWLRVSVEGGGCSGFQYKLDLEEDGEAGEADELGCFLQGIGGWVKEGHNVGGMGVKAVNVGVGGKEELGPGGWR